MKYIWRGWEITEMYTKFSMGKAEGKIPEQ
jgi:hypothetical protein